LALKLILFSSENIKTNLYLATKLKIGSR